VGGNEIILIEEGAEGMGVGGGHGITFEM